MIEGYLFGLATPEERLEFEQKLKTEPELRHEFELAQKSLLTYEQHFDLAIPKEMEDKIWDKLSNTNQSKIIEKESVITSAEKMVAKKASLIVRLMPFVVAASLALFSVSTYMALDYKSQRDAAEARVQELEQKNQLLASQFGSQSSELTKAVKMVNTFNQHGMNVIKLSGKEIAPSASVMVCWNKMSKELMIDDIKLPTAPQGKGYQLWAIVDGKPVNAGMIDITNENMLQMKNGINNPTAFAVTLEVINGSEIPTMDQMFVYGSM